VPLAAARTRSTGIRCAGCTPSRLLGLQEPDRVPTTGPTCERTMSVKSERLSRSRCRRERPKRLRDPNMNPTRVYVTPVGEPGWNRFVIRRGKRRYWSGTGWSHDPREARLYHEELEAASQAAVLHDSIRPRRFVTAVLIAVDHDRAFNVEQVQRLMEHSVVSVVLPEHEEHVDIEITLDWRGIEEIE